MFCGIFYRIAVYKAIYPSVGTMADVIAAIDQVSAETYSHLGVSNIITSS